jgi:hypothetical protein
MSLIHRAGTTIVSSALAFTLVSGGAATASPVHARAATPQAASGATWLTHQLTHGLVHNNEFDFDDYGLTADTALALKAIGGHPKKVHAIRKALARHVDDYTTFKKSVFAGSVAKLLVVAQDTGADPRHFGGVNLVRRLAQRVSTTAPIAGRIQDKSSTDFANTIGQVFAARGLVRAGNGHAADALSFLLEQQCKAGFFRLSFATSTTSAKRSCDSGTAAENAPDTDVTALAVVELSSIAQGQPSLTKALHQALAWLARQQAANGSFGGGPSTSKPNTNSTGLAAWALGIGGRCGPAGQAAAWVAKKQLGGKLAGTPLAGERGAIAYDGAALKAARTSGITTKTQDQWRRATTQAAPGLLYLTSGACRAA